MNDDFIELGLRGALATSTPPLLLRTVINKLLGLLRDFVAVMDVRSRRASRPYRSLSAGCHLR